MIIDAHAHIMPEIRGHVGAGPTRSLPYGKMGIGDQVLRVMPPLCETTSFGPELLLENMDWAGVDKAVLLQGPFFGEVNEYVWQAVKKWPDRFIGAGFFDPRSSDAREVFRRNADMFGFGIIKLECSEACGLVGLYPDLRLDEEAMAWIWEAAETRNMVVTLDLGGVGCASYQTDAVRRILDKHSKLRIVIAHLAFPPIIKMSDDSLNQLWRDQILLGNNPNVWFDIASLPALSGSEDYPYATAREYIRQAVELIGAEKLMWGTDIPGVLPYATYPQHLNYVARHCDFLSDVDLQKILGGNAWQVYGESGGW